MFNSFVDQLGEIIELYKEDEKPNHNMEFFNWILTIVVNSLFVITCFILAWKGVFFLYDYLFPHPSFQPPNSNIKWGLRGMLKYPAVIAAIAFVCISVVKLIVIIKMYIRPFQILAIIGIGVMIKKIWIMTFSKDFASYEGFLRDIWEGMFR